MHTDWPILPMLMAEFGDIGDWSLFIGQDVIKLFSCSAQLGMKFSLLINDEIKISILIFMSRINNQL